MILGYQAVGGRNDGLRRAVVLLQLKEFGPLVHLRKLQDILDVRPSEGINTLSIIAHYTYLLVFAGELEHNAMLGIIGILILVHQHISELRSILYAYLRIISEKEESMHQQIIEVHGITLSTSLPITTVNVANGWHLGFHVCLYNRRIRSVSIRQDEVILGIADATLHITRLVNLVIQLHFFNDALDQTLRIRSVIDGKIGGETDSLCLHTENARENGMESPHP